MNRSRHKRVALLSVVLLALLIAAPVVLTWRQLRQERLNQALIAAVKRNDDRAVVALLNEGANANCRDEPLRKFSLWQTLMQIVRGRKPQRSRALTPLLLALEPQPPDFDDPPENLRLVRALLNHGALVNLADRRVTPLLCAVSGGKNATVQLLLAHGAKTQGPGLLWRAVLFNVEVGVIADLLDRGADVKQKDAQGTTSLSYAVTLRRVDVVRLLLARHADPAVTDSEGKTPLTQAREDDTPQSRQIVRLLKLAGAQR